MAIRTDDFGPVSAAVRLSKVANMPLRLIARPSR
jgi:hypothetical protein